VKRLAASLLSLVAAACSTVPDYRTVATDLGGGMVAVPAGLFTMGDDAGEQDEQPPRPVRLSGFLIDPFEVTNGAYSACVEAGACRPLDGYEGSVRHPVVTVSWFDAERFCTFVGKRLPSEAEWERAARGTGAHRYPWGSNSISPAQANVRHVNRAAGKTMTIDTLRAGRSSVGAFHMSGNVAEWVADDYDPTVYQRMVAEQGPRPEEGGQKVVRGGSFRSVAYVARVSARASRAPGSRWDDVGFRCARSL
jgi:formylglycine-generating enzyme required for sulfatase activity